MGKSSTIKEVNPLPSLFFIELYLETIFVSINQPKGNR